MEGYRLDFEKNARWRENNPEKPGDIVDCPFCDASGECPHCLPKDGHDCFKCGFTRKCFWCRGSGKLKVKEITGLILKLQDNRLNLNICLP